MRSLRPCPWLSLALLCASCGSGSAAPGTPPDAGASKDAFHPDGHPHDATPDRRPPEDAGEAGMPSPCDTRPACTGTPTTGQTCVGTVDATLVDPSSSPAVGIAVTICGTNLCSTPVKSDASGKVHFPLCIYMNSPSLRIFDDPAWVPFAARLPVKAAVSLGTVTVTPLPKAGMAFPAGSGRGTVTSSGVSLQVAAGSVMFDGVHMAQGANAEEFRAAEVATLPPGLSGGPVTVAWGLAPQNTLLIPGATLTVPNTKGWSPLAQVNFYLDGTDETKTAIAPWGEWGPIGVGAVSSDGSTITLSASSGGLAEIAMIGVALK